MSPRPKRFLSTEEQLDVVFDTFLHIEDTKLSIEERGPGDSDVVADAPITIYGRQYGNAPGIRTKGPTGNNVHARRSQNLDSDTSTEEEPEGATAASVGVSEDEVKEAARVLAEVGDEFDSKYSDKMPSITPAIITPAVKTLFEENEGRPAYEIFAGVLNSLIGEDRDVAALTLVLSVAKDVIKCYPTVGSTVKDLFRNFVKAAFQPAVEEKGNIVEFTKETPK